VLVTGEVGIGWVVAAQLDRCEVAVEEQRQRLVELTAGGENEPRSDMAEP
jgi:hypothetical protein